MCTSNSCTNIDKQCTHIDSISWILQGNHLIVCISIKISDYPDNDFDDSIQKTGAAKF